MLNARRVSANWQSCSTGEFVVADVPVAVNGIVDTEDVEAVSSPKTKIESWEATEEIEAEEGF